MEFFNCPCDEKGNVILDGNDLGPNQDAAGNLLTKQCNAGLHRITLRGPDGRTFPPKEMDIKNTNPISPMEVPFP